MEQPTSVDNDLKPEPARNRRKPSAAVAALERRQHDHVDIIDGAEILNEADRRLAELGYVAVYKREFSWLSCFSFAVSISGLYASVATTYVYPLVAGGASAAVWGWLISGFGGMTIALSVSELVSAYPTSGGLYFTCKYLAPPAWVPEISWLCGWLNLLGQIAGVASTEYGCAQLLLAAVSMSFGFSYAPTNQHTVGVMAALTLFHGALNSLSTNALEKMTRSYVIFHFAVLLSCCITLLVMDKNKHDSAFVWTNITPSSGWSPVGFSFLFSFLSASWTMTDYDGLGIYAVNSCANDNLAHIAEEIKDPELKAPWAIALALGTTYIGGWLFTIVLTYSAGSIDEILASPVAQPVAQIFYNVIGPAGGVFFTVCAFIVLNFTAMTAIQAGARTVWAYSRDEMLPLSRVWYKINKTTQTPLYSVWLFVIVCILINLIGLGSYTAIAAIFSLTAIALDWSYCIPILCKMLYGKFEPGPFHLGKASYWINLYAVLWTLFVSIIFVLPSVLPVTPQNMNYVSVIMVAVALFAVVYWYAAGRFYYTGPRVRTQLIESSVVGDQKRVSDDDEKNVVDY